MTAPAPFHTFILKVANRCNIDCDYCYVFNSADDAWRHMPARMSIDVAQASGTQIAAHARAHGLSSVHVVLHGGEPLLAGPRHLGQVLEALQQRLLPATGVSFELQTNGTLITESWLDLFEQYQVAVGVSLDGPPSANDRHRLSHTARSTSAAAVRGIEALRTRPGLFAGILAVVDLANNPVEVHDYLAAFHPPVIDFNLPHATHDQPPVRSGAAAEYEYGRWLADLHDRWLADPDPAHRHTIRMLEDIHALSAGVRGSVESLGLAAPGIVVIESDGTVESIDTLRSAEPGASQLGLDVFQHSFDQVRHHPKMALRAGGTMELADICRSCALVQICGGGYLPHRFSIANGYRNPSVYCSDLTYLIGHVQRSTDSFARTHDSDEKRTAGNL